MRDITVLETVRTRQLHIAGWRGFTEFRVPGTERTYSVLVYDTDGGLAGPYHLDEGTEFVRDREMEKPKAGLITRDPYDAAANYNTN